MSEEPIKLPDYDKNRNYPDRYYKIERPFIAWDGEGITNDNSPQQAYVLLAASTGDFIRNPNGLTTQDCLDLLFRVEEENRSALHIGFGFGYDTNQILNSFTRRELCEFDARTKIGRNYTWRGRIKFKYYPGKSLQITRGISGEPDFVNIRIDDTFHFFQRKFIDVVRSYFPELVSEIEDGKQNRASFNYRDIDEITRYCLAENKILVKIMDRLRGHFEDYGLFLRNWHGPGTVANSSMRLHQIKESMANTPKEVKHAAQYGYQGGRFELLRAGYYSDRVWQYDINSAYPSEIANLPSFKDGYWEYVTVYEPEVYGIWHISYCDRGTVREDYFNPFRARPFFFRNRKGGISYPSRTENWYWQPEIDLWFEIPGSNKEDFEIKEGWVWRTNNEEKPFEWVKDRYLKRLELKKRGDGGERAIKLELNSLYGKMAQRAGWYQSGDKIPRYHQLEWAGFVTSATRAKLLRAYIQEPEAIIAFETDAIFSMVPLDLPLGEGLGEWTETSYDDILYIQSGFYYLNSGTHRSLDSQSRLNSVSHYRGFDKNDSLSFDKMMTWLDSINPGDPFYSLGPEKMFGSTTRFVGYKRALMTNARWRSWIKEDREITIGVHGKREHTPMWCPLCRKGKKFTEGMHFLEIGSQAYDGEKIGDTIPMSYPHNIPWLEELAWEEEFDWNSQLEMEFTDGNLNL